MKSIVGIYDSHDKAFAALQELKNSGYPTGLLSVIGKAELVNGHLYIKSKDAVEKAELSLGALAGAILGILTVRVVIYRGMEATKYMKAFEDFSVNPNSDMPSDHRKIMTYIIELK